MTKSTKYQILLLALFILPILLNGLGYVSDKRMFLFLIGLLVGRCMMIEFNMTMIANMLAEVLDQLIDMCERTK